MLKILVIEDNKEIRENTAELLSLNDFTVFIAENGSQGFDLALKVLPDLILCDMMMPVTGGKTFLNLVKSNKILQHTPLVFFSAGSISIERKKLLIRGADAFISKPFSEETLLNAIKNVILNKQFR